MARFDISTFDETLLRAKEGLMAFRSTEGYWEGKLSSSALSTATAVCALAVVIQAEKSNKADEYQQLIQKGLEWLARNINADGGWGDTIRSPSNISTTTLVWSAFGIAGDLSSRYSEIISKAEKYLSTHAGGIQPQQLAKTITARYGKDRTFSIPILLTCVLAGRFGSTPEVWQWVKPLPFELAACPHTWFKWLRLPVVSYALPALIAIGQARHHHLSTQNPITRFLRNLTKNRTLKLLTDIQPTSGGFLEAIPLTSFVVMSLAASGQVNHPVVTKGIEFLISSVREDGSWAIDTNLSTWVTTLAINAMAIDPSFHDKVSEQERKKMCAWLLCQQYKQEHPYTHAKAGGWAWTPRSGGVPDADDTAGALLALRNLGIINREVQTAVENGIEWLLDLQNQDGGIPTFCKGWGTLPFDRSSPDLTAHVLRAMLVWSNDLPSSLKQKTLSATKKGISYLAKTQKADGAWAPLWFGNPLVANDENLTYGTSRVLITLEQLQLLKSSYTRMDDLIFKGIHWLLSAQNQDGGWGGAKSIPSSIEETAFAVDALAKFLGTPHLSKVSIEEIGKEGELLESIEQAVSKGVEWLIQRTDQGKKMVPTPIGFYFAKLWYFEELYPRIFTVAALERVKSAR